MNKILNRIIDLLLASIVLLVFFPIILVLILLVYLQDKNNPFYISNRVGLNFKEFKIYKIRSMTVDADKNKVDTTTANDPRITKLGKFIRKYKFDEITQLFNVVLGDMSLIGPRPNVKREVDLYTFREKKLLSVKPGITDLSTIFFSNEGDILANSKNPNNDYNMLIRPWKSRLALINIINKSFWLDIKVLYITIIAIFNKTKSEKIYLKTFNNLIGVDNKIKDLIKNKNFYPYPPPGSKKIFYERN